MTSARNSNLYYPVMYLIEKSIKKHFGDGNGPNTAVTETIEPVTLHRDPKGRLVQVEGWEYLDVDLTYGSKGILEVVDIVHRITAKHLRITLEYDEKLMLENVIPEIIEQGLGDPGEINLPDVISSY